MDRVTFRRMTISDMHDCFTANPYDYTLSRLYARSEIDIHLPTLFV